MEPFVSFTIIIRYGTCSIEIHAGKIDLYCHLTNVFILGALSFVLSFFLTRYNKKTRITVIEIFPK